MRRDVVNIIADAEPAELAAGLVFSDARIGSKKRLNDGRVRIMLYLPAGTDMPGPSSRERHGGQANRHGLEDSPSRI